MELKAKRKLQRKRRVKARIFGTEARPRLSVFRSIGHIYAQIIDDDKMQTIAAASDVKMKAGKKAKGLEHSRKVDSAAKVGEELAKAAIAKKVKKVTFDRNGFTYHGRVKALADGARKGGLEF